MIEVKKKRHLRATFALLLYIAMPGATWAQGVTLGAPPDGGVGTNPPVLQVTVSDPEANAMAVTFYGRRVPTPTGPDFSITLLPDTQNYTAGLNGGTPAMFVAQTAWIVSNRAARNIVYVNQLGDCSNSGDINENEWLNATNAMYRLEDAVATGVDGGIPYGVSVGNHDRLGTGNAVLYNRYFGVSRFSGRAYYGGHYGTDNSSYFNVFDAGGMEFVVLSLRFGAGSAPAIISWANGVLQSNANRRAIVVSHSLINPGNPGSWTSEGPAIFEGLKANTNLFLMLCGHQHGEGIRQDSVDGRTITTVLTDYQSYANGGNGYLRMMEFSPSNNHIRMTTYSPVLDQYETDADSQFTLTNVFAAAAVPFMRVADFTNVASASQASCVWSNLENGAEYEWYVAISNQGHSATSGIWRFTAVPPPPPAVVVTRPAAGQVVHPWRGVNIAWRTRDVMDAVNVELWRGTNFVMILTNNLASPTTNMTWHASLPGDLAEGRDYTVTVIDADRPGDFASSGAFRVLLNAGLPWLHLLLGQ